MNTLIIEDEFAASEALKTLLEQTETNIEVLAVLQTIDESVEWFKSHEAPDLVFMDIHLADGSSFSIFDEIEITSPIIFTTAYDEYALKAFSVNSIDYLLKPINKDDLKRAIEKFKHLKNNPNHFSGEAIKQLIENIKAIPKNYKSCFLVSIRDKIIPLRTADIACIYIDSKIVKAITYNRQTYYLNQTLDEIEGQLNPSFFFRINRQIIIARDAVKEINQWFSGRLSITLTIPMDDKILISKARVNEFKNWLSNEPAQ